MSSGEFMDYEVAMRHVRDPQFVGSLVFEIEETKHVAGYEVELAKRFDVDKNEFGIEVVTFELGSTWEDLLRDYTKRQRMNPTELYVAAEIGMGSAATEYLMPFNRAPLAGKALITAYGYRPRAIQHSQSDRSSARLTRRLAGSAIIENPLLKQAGATDRKDADHDVYQLRHRRSFGSRGGRRPRSNY